MKLCQMTAWWEEERKEEEDDAQVFDLVKLVSGPGTARGGMIHG